MSEPVEMRKCVKSSCTGLKNGSRLDGVPLHEREKKQCIALRWRSALRLGMGIRHAFNDSDCRRLIDPRKPPPPNPNFHLWTITPAKSGQLVLNLIKNP